MPTRPGDSEIVIVVTSSSLEEVAEQLREAGHPVEVARDVIAAAGAADRGAAVMIGAPTDLAALGEIEGIETLAICCEGESCAGRLPGGEALAWPGGRDLLEQRVAALRERQRLRVELEQRRAVAELAAQLGPMLDRGAFEEALHDALLQLVDRCAAERALVIAWHAGGEVGYLVGNSEDPRASRLPVLARVCPEIAEIGSFERRLVPDAPVSSRVAAYGGSVEQELRRSLLLLPLRDGQGVVGLLELHFVGDVLSEPGEDLARQFASTLAPRLRCAEIYHGLRDQTRRITLAEVERGQRPEMLRRYEEFYQRSFDGIVVLDPDDKVIYLNSAGAQITGYSKQGLVGTPLAMLVVEHDRERLAEVLVRVRQHGAHSFEIGLLTTSGDPILVSVSTSSLLTDDAALVLSFRDITEARALSDELRATKEFLERLIDSTIDGIVAADNSGEIVVFNRGAERMSGYQEQDVVGRMHVEELFPTGVGERVIEQLHDEAGGAGRLQALRKEIVSAQGEVVPVSLSASLIREGDVDVGTVYVLRDLRDQMRIERRLVQAQEQLHATEKQALIAELAGTTAHELNQPLTSMMGFAQLLKLRLGADPALQKVVDTLVEEAERMADIVRKIGKITKYETRAYVGGAQILDLEKSSE